MVLSPVSDALDLGCVIVTGAPGAGKSTVSRLVAQSLERSALLSGDLINELIVSGRVWALGEPADEAARQVMLCNKNLCALALNFADSGLTPVIDWLIPDREQLDYFVSGLSPHRVLLVVLDPSIDVCRYRNTIRDKAEQFFFDDYETLIAGMRAGFGEIGWWFDTSALTPDETAAHIVANAATLARIGV